MTNRLHPFRSARSAPHLNLHEGQELFALQDTETGLFFRWAYSSRAFAEHMATRLTIDSPSDELANWVRSTNSCSISHRELRIPDLIIQPLTRR